MTSVVPSHYVLYNTEKIPQYNILTPAGYEVGEYIKVPSHHALIETSQDIVVLIGGSLYILKAGTHYFPYLPTFHEFMIPKNAPVKVSTIMFESFYCEMEEAQKMLLRGPAFIVYSGIASPDGTHAIMSAGVYGSTPDLAHYLTTNGRKAPTIPKHKSVQIPNVRSLWLYHKDISKIQKDPEVTKYFLTYDKDFVRCSMPPCIAVTYRDTDMEALRQILSRKYGISEIDGEIAYTSVPKTQKELDQDVTQLRDKIMAAYETLKDNIEVVWSEKPREKQKGHDLTLTNEHPSKHQRIK